MSGDLLMVVAMLVAVAGVAVVALLLARAPSDERVSDRWIDAHVRERRDD
jgi:Tfp pilus assembly protein PilN